MICVSNLLARELLKLWFYLNIAVDSFNNVTAVFQIWLLSIVIKLPYLQINKLMNLPLLQILTYIQMFLGGVSVPFHNGFV